MCYLMGWDMRQLIKLLAIRNNALAIWQNYQFELDVSFDEIWGK